VAGRERKRKGRERKKGWKRRNGSRIGIANLLVLA